MTGKRIGRPPGIPNPGTGPRKIPLIIEVPPRAIVLDQVMYWINLQATAEEIAGSFRVSVETLNARIREHFGLSYAELRKRVDGEGKLSLRRYQFKLAERNTGMAIWLGKQWLGQKDDHDDKRNLPPNDILLTALIGEIKAIKDTVYAPKPEANSVLQTGEQTV